MSGTFATLLNPLEPAKTAVLLDVVNVSREVSTPFMLFGAFARDVHFFHAHGVEITRKTEDVDVSIQVKDWDADILPSSESDLDLASATLIGRDMARFLGKDARALVVNFLEHEVESDSRCYLVRGMTGQSFDSFGRAREIVAALLRGVQRSD